MESKQDQAGHMYFEVENIRITVIPETWNGEPGIRIQAYKGDGNKLFQGAELPLGKKNKAYDFLTAIHHALERANIQS